MRQHTIGLWMALSMAATMSGGIQESNLFGQAGRQLQTLDQSIEQSEDQSTDQRMEPQEFTEPTPVTIDSLEQQNTGYKLQLRFTAEDRTRADGYEIEIRRATEKEWKKVAELKADDKLVYTTSKLTLGEKVGVRVRSYQADENGEMHYSAYAQTEHEVGPNQVKLKAVTSVSYKQLKVEWAAQKDASAYQIYISEKKDSGYKRIKTVQNPKTDHATISNLKPDRKYYVKMRAYYKKEDVKYYGVYSEILAAPPVCAAPQNVTITASNGGKLTVSWKKVSGAQTYTVLRAKEKNGTYQQIKGNLKTCKYQDSKLTAGKKYYYRVYAVRNGKNGKKSAKTGQYSKSLTVQEKKITMVVGSSHQLLARALPSTALKWKSSNASVLSVTTSGWAHASKCGQTKVSVRAHGFTQTVTVKVKKRIDGIDVSRWQGNVNWPAVAGAGKKFVMLRVWHTAASAEESKDITFETNYKEARATGIKVGCYAYSTATNVRDAAAEAYNVIHILNGRHMDYPVVMDLESSNQLALTNAQRTDLVFAFKNVIESHGYKFALYANTYWMDHYIDNKRLGNMDLWVARYSPGPTTGHEYSGGGKVIMWQYTNKGRVSGIQGDVDLDYSYKSY